MGRHKEFDDKPALERAMFLFWEKGYEGASLKELLAAMDILNGSFYHSFGSKKALFLRALSVYNADFSAKRQQAFRPGRSFKKAIRMVVTHVLDRQSDAACPKGCFLFNSVAADALADDDIRKMVRAYIADFEALIAEQMQLAIDAGELDARLDARLVASVLVTYIQGCMRLCVLDFDEVALKAQTEHFLTSLGI